MITLYIIIPTQTPLLWNQFGLRRLTPPPPLKLNSKHFCFVKPIVNNSVLGLLVLATVIGMAEAKTRVGSSET